jgi:LysM repeat protein
MITVKNNTLIIILLIVTFIFGASLIVYSQMRSPAAATVALSDTPTSVRTVTASPTNTVTPTPSITPTPSLISYKVIAGDTASGIAAKFNIKLESIIKANPDLNPDLLFAGQTLMIPPPGWTPSPTPTLPPDLTANVLPDASSVRFRKDPGEAETILTFLPGNTQLKVLGRTADKDWIEVQLGNQRGWVQAQWLHLPVSVANLPVTGQTRIPTPTHTLTPTPIPPPPADPYTFLAPPGVSARAREIYRRGLQLGNNPRAFSKAGDCHSDVPNFLGEFDSGRYSLGKYGYLQHTINQFKGSFAPKSLAAASGSNLAMIINPLWSDPKLCGRTEKPLECEVRAHKPSIMFVAMGTNEYNYSPQDYEEQMRVVLDYLISKGVLPIMVTKADQREGLKDLLNPINRKLAKEYDVPLWDFWVAAQKLPNKGLLENKIHLTYSVDIFHFDSPEALELGWTIRNLTGLQALDVVWRGVR